MAQDEFGKVPKFLRRLYRETSDPANPSITWSEDGERVQIQHKDSFRAHTLPLLSKTKEYSAFVRQLNIYGFVKMRGERGEDMEEYFHPHFKRDRPELMAFIKRMSKSNKSEAQMNWQVMENSISYLTANNYRLANELAILKERVSKQEQAINGLLDILGRVFRTGLQNFSIDPMYNKQNIDQFFQYTLGASPEEEIERQTMTMTDSPPKKILPKKKESPESEHKSLPDMNDIFF